MRSAFIMMYSNIRYPPRRTAGGRRITPLSCSSLGRRSDHWPVLTSTGSAAHTHTSDSGHGEGEVKLIGVTGKGWNRRTSRQTPDRWKCRRCWARRLPALNFTCVAHADHARRKNFRGNKRQMGLGINIFENRNAIPKQNWIDIEPVLIN